MWLAVLSRTFLYTSLSIAGKAAEEYVGLTFHVILHPPDCWAGGGKQTAVRNHSIGFAHDSQLLFIAWDMMLNL